jgi:hypothetical protein
MREIKINVPVHIAFSAYVAKLDFVTLSTTPLKVGSSIILSAFIFGVRIEQISPNAALITATGTILKL